MAYWPALRGGVPRRRAGRARRHDLAGRAALRGGKGNGALRRPVPFPAYGGAAALASSPSRTLSRGALGGPWGAERCSGCAVVVAVEPAAPRGKAYRRRGAGRGTWRAYPFSRAVGRLISALGPSSAKVVTGRYGPGPGGGRWSAPHLSRAEPCPWRPGRAVGRRTASGPAGGSGCLRRVAGLSGGFVGGNLARIPFQPARCAGEVAAG